MEDLNNVVQSIANKKQHADFKKSIFAIFDANKDFPESENLALTIDLIRTKFQMDFTSLLTLWFKEWKEGKIGN